MFFFSVLFLFSFWSIFNFLWSEFIFSFSPFPFLPHRFSIFPGAGYLFKTTHTDRNKKKIEQATQDIFHHPTVSDSLVLLLTLFLCLVSSVPPLHLTLVLFLLLLFTSSFHLPCQRIATSLSIAPSLFHPHILPPPTGFIICPLYLAAFHQKKQTLKMSQSWVSQRHSVNVGNEQVSKKNAFYCITSLKKANKINNVLTNWKQQTWEVRMCMSFKGATNDTNVV